MGALSVGALGSVGENQYLQMIPWLVVQSSKIYMREVHSGCGALVLTGSWAEGDLAWRRVKDGFRLEVRLLML